MFLKSKSIVIASTLFALLSLKVHSTVVEVQTSMGIIEINLFDETTPKTVENFLSYVNSGRYANGIIHRSIPNFVIQSGGFTYSDDVASGGILLDNLSTDNDSFVVNEPELSNVRGTIAMAKGSDPDSAKSQWFINLDDNSQALDVATNSGGFTVFGQVIGDGMQVVDAIQGVSIFQYASPFTDIPLRNFTTSDFDNGVELTDDNLVIITDIVVSDATVVTNPDLNPVVNTLINSSPSGGNNDSGGGGSIFWLALMAVCSLQVRKCFR
jgi:peptidyl-prolyl cis-trans isomerase A (cyclophilin A)